MSDTISFRIPMGNDEDGFFGRECPREECLGYFKIELGTGLKGEDLPCHCPYCGHTASHDQFWTQDQLEYARSVALRKVQEDLDEIFKDALKPTRPRRGDFVTISWEFKPGTPLPLHHYTEKRLETAQVCDTCGLRYAVYGVFAYCPDCGSHNSFQILSSNLDVAAKELELAGTLNPPLSDQLLSDALENAVAAFDGFGREIFRVNADLSAAPAKAVAISCQNLAGMKDRVAELFGFDLEACVGTDDWSMLVRAFQKRHLIAHKMGIVDDAYLAATGDRGAVKGRKVALTTSEVELVLPILHKLGKAIQEKLEQKRLQGGDA